MISLYKHVCVCVNSQATCLEINFQGILDIITEAVCALLISDLHKQHSNLSPMYKNATYIWLSAFIIQLWWGFNIVIRHHCTTGHSRGQLMLTVYLLYSFGKHMAKNNKLDPMMGVQHRNQTPLYYRSFAGAAHVNCLFIVFLQETHG